VNACACEFLEQMLSNVEPKEKGPEVAEMIINPIIAALNNAIANRDTVMQVELLSIIRIILFNCNYDNHQYRINATEIFSHNLFMPIIKKGVRSEISFVRSSYITFVENVLPLFTRFLQHSSLTSIISQLVCALCQLLESCFIGPTFKASQEEKVITNENDILQIIHGISSIIYHCFEENYKKNKVPKVEKSSGMLKIFAGRSAPKIAKFTFDETCLVPPHFLFSIFILDNF
jgi:hypothetical protein